jgi:leucyl-tRNA synthetase
MGDVEPDFNEYTVIKFRSEDYVIPAATLRPETLFGVTNMWINPYSEYVKARVDGENWILSKEAAKKLEFLNHKIEILETIRGKEIVGWKVKNPIGNTVIPVFPASFVEADNGTGIVMSVPAHAPFDYQALEDLKKDVKTQQEFYLSVDINPIRIIESEGYADLPSAEAIMSIGASGQTDFVLEKATNDLYSHEFYKGKMMGNTGKFAGMTVAVAKNHVRQELIESGIADTMYELINKPVKCRCGTECVVKLLNDQWFLNYGDKDWKTLAHECINNMDIVPEDIRMEFNYIIDWLKERACARKSGLGTKLPWDREWIIESLSDSVIYMVYYILAKYVNNNTLGNNIDDEFFDYVLLGIGNAEEVAKQSNISVSTLRQIKDEFQYFYPVDSRHSGRDLVPNHLTFFIFNHVAIFDKEKWPRQIVVNGSVLMEGKKMSKSLGNIIPLRTAIRENGADVIRLAMLVSAEILQDADFSFDTVRGIRSKLIGIFEMADRYSFKEQSISEARELEDRWLASRLQHAIADTSASMDKLRMREAIHHILYSLDQDLQWYLKRTQAKARNNIAAAVKDFLKIQVQMLAPFAPFTSEEVWERMGNRNSITEIGWPVIDESKIDLIAEESEFLIANLLSDLQKIIKVTKMLPSKIIIYTSAEWKNKVYHTVLVNILGGRTGFGEIMKELISNPETSKVKTDPKIVQKMIEDVLSIPYDARVRRQKLSVFREETAIADAANLLSAEMNDSQLSVYCEENADKHDPKSKARFARPFKPAIYVE